MTGRDPSEDVTELLRLWRSGDRNAEDQLFRIVLPELQRIAGRLVRGERADEGWQPTELINELYLRLTRSRGGACQDREHFFALAARAMRHALIDHARSRPKATFLPLEAAFDKSAVRDTDPEFLAKIGILLDELAIDHPDWCSIVELKYFVGLTDDEAAEVLQCPLRSLQRRWHDARLWLFERICGAGREERT